MIKKIVLSKYYIKPLKKNNDLINIANLIIQVFPEYYNYFKSSKAQMGKNY